MMTERDLLALAQENERLRAENRRLAYDLNKAKESIVNKLKMIAERDRIILKKPQTPREATR